MRTHVCYHAQDGVLQHDEIMALLSPQHQAHSIAEAYELARVSDTDGDHELSPEEITAAHTRLVNTRLLNYGDRARKDVDEVYEGLAAGVIQHMFRNRDEL